MLKELYKHMRMSIKIQKEYVILIKITTLKLFKYIIK